ncbi:hypothetical protein RUM44_002090 [Polyplax serrata]|uniref:Uncharacterized protein n=1 Tax=Polyplax serrata TaxID=468196 RepID=A0ABR1ALW8_POLSC
MKTQNWAGHHVTHDNKKPHESPCTWPDGLTDRQTGNDNLVLPCTRGTQVPALQSEDRSQSYTNHTTTTINHLNCIQPSMEAIGQDIMLPTDGAEHCVDRSEFDKYIKYNRGCESQRMDSNHNYPHHPVPTQTSYYPGVEVKTDHGGFPGQGFDPLKSEDDFSVILAGVRKTCYSS